MPLSQVLRRGDFGLYRPEIQHVMVTGRILVHCVKKVPPPKWPAFVCWAMTGAKAIIRLGAIFISEQFVLRRQ